jgi:hypothetical protein
MKKKKKPVIDKYTQPIFPPFDLYVCKNFTEEDLKNTFVWSDGQEITEEELKCCKGETLSVLYKKDDPEKNLCIIILLYVEEFEKGTDYACVCAHEASHATFRILEYCGIKLTDDTTEVFAFMEGWITECCVKTYKKKDDTDRA